MLNCRYDEDHKDGSERPTDNKRQERKLENVKPNVSTELWVNDSEVNAVCKKQPTLPLRGNSGTDE
jgi:hypothetical protein